MSKNIKKTIIIVLSVLTLLLFFTINQILLGFDFGDKQLLVSLFIFLSLSSINKKLGITYLYLSFGLALIYGFVGLSYGPIDQNAIDALRYTDPTEAFEYASSFSLDILAWYSSLIVTFILSIKITLSFKSIHLFGNKKFTAVFLITAISLALTGPARDAIKGLPINIDKIRSTEFIFALNTYRSIKSSTENQQKFSIFTKNAEWNSTSAPNEIQNYVLIMGESVRKDFMHAYGAPWENTPWLSSANGILFTNFTSASASTVASLTRELCITKNDTILPAYNIVTLAKNANFATSWLSGQGERGEHESPISVIAKMADHYEFIKNEINPITKIIKKNDFDLIPSLEEALKDQGQKKLVILHLHGSHPKACSRTNDEYQEFFRSKELSCYIQSIRNTDSLISKVADILKKRERLYGEKWSLLYTSDHGLDFTEDKDGWIMKHSDKRQGSYKVPFFITGSNFHDRSYITSDRSGLSFVALIGEWLNIQSPKLPIYKCSLLQEGDCENQDSIYRFSSIRIPINALPNYDLNDFIKDHPAP